MKSNKEVLKIARSYLGKGGAIFRKFCNLPAGSAYCNAFVDYIAYKGGVSSLYFNGKKITYCPTSYSWCRKNLAALPLYMAMESDIIYFDWDKNGVPNHIGLVKKRRDTSSIYTVEGNTDKKDKNGKVIARNVVAERTREGKYVLGVFRPHYVKTGMAKAALKIDGEFEYKSIYMLQVALGMKPTGVFTKETVKFLQKKAGATQDGWFGPGTAKKVQAMIGAKQDSQFGPASVRKLQEWINKATGYAAKPAAPKPSTPSKPTTTPTLKSRRIDVDLTNQVCTVYGVYSDGSVKPIMSEFCSTARKGKTTPVGNWKISSSGSKKAKYRTAKMSGGKSYAEYLVRFKGAKCMHTVPYKNRQTTGHVNKSEFNKLGTPRSAGCVRLPWIMAQYIYTTCPVGTPVRVFKGKAGSYPMGKPKKYTATKDVDPTYKK